MNNYTILIPTKDRPEYLKRLLNYLKTFNNLNIIIGDSSDDVLSDVLNYTHRFYPNDTDPYLKIKDMLELVTTPYIVLCADDDFINPEAIEQCIEFLEVNEDYSCCHGRYIGFKKESNKFKWRFIYGDEDNDKNTPTFYAVHRTEQLKSSFLELDVSTINREWFLQLCDFKNGKIRMLPVLYYFKGQEISKNPIKRLWRNVSQDWDTYILDCNKFDILRKIQAIVLGYKRVELEYLKDYREDTNE